MFEFQINDVCISADEEGHNLAESSFKKLYKSPEFIKMLEQTKLKNGPASLDTDKMNRILKEQEKNKKPVNYETQSNEDKGNERVKNNFFIFHLNLYKYFPKSIFPLTILIPSFFSIAVFFPVPDAKPPTEPSVFTTRWQGTFGE